ncbi:MAG: hypothetical protein MJ177_10080 [Clostridia bacterium]|nr:hypothetical protein [Clostridia bacterium]
MKKYFITACAVTLSLILSPVISVNTLRYIQTKSEMQYVEYTARDGEKITVELNSFIAGSVASVMPGKYEPEALKAQAVCIRTYLFYLKSRNEAVTYEKISYNSDETDEKITECVNSTSGVQVYYKDSPAMTLSHALNNGKTTAMEGFPYLTEVESSGDLLSPDESEEKAFHGMSRYGADFMARQGADFKEIILHYFPGTKIISE